MKPNFLEKYDFFAGVPDSLLNPLSTFLFNKHGIGVQHIIGANEGNCVGLAAGYYLATGKTPVVYLQNSGLGNIVNPVASLLNENVYGIPCLFIIGWRGEPGLIDEPQHVFQGEITEELLDILGIESYIIDKETSETDVFHKLVEFDNLLKNGKQVAFLVKKGALQGDNQIPNDRLGLLSREEIIREIVSFSGEDPVICTTGKASRELYEIRQELGQSHEFDFLTVGSMGHSSSIALEIAIQKPELKIWCIDGDGAVLMHMGALALIGSNCPSNFVHIVINNGAHDSVGGMPTVAASIDFVNIAKGCGYPEVASVKDMRDLRKNLMLATSEEELRFIEIKCAIGSRANLGRPTTPAKMNRIQFQSYLQQINVQQ